MNQPSNDEGRPGFRDAVWPDVLAFAGGLALAWWQQWKTSDLVWSLWLSSLVVGFALIVWLLSAPLRELIAGMRADPSPGAAVPKLITIGILGTGVLLGVAFFTVHFGGFHFGHSVFLNGFFPVLEGGERGWPGLAVYVEVVRRYWWFLPAAALAERKAFLPPVHAIAPKVTPPAIRPGVAAGNALMAPYRNVVRMHLLIFFFAGVHLLGFENFAVYAVVYAVYFFPWRVLRRNRPAELAA